MRRIIWVPMLTRWSFSRYPGAFNIYIDRDPRLVWHSYKQQMSKGNYTFFEGWLTVIEQNSQHPLINHFTQDTKTRSVLQRVVHKRKRYYHKLLDTLNDAQTYKMVFKFWCLSTITALNSAHLIIDMELMADTNHRETIKNLINDNTSINLGFNDFNSKGVPQTNDNFDWNAIELEAVQEISGLYDENVLGAFSLQDLQQLSPRKQKLLGSFIAS